MQDTTEIDFLNIYIFALIIVLAFIKKIILGNCFEGKVE